MRHRFKTLLDILEYSSSKYAKRPASDYVDGGCAYTFASFREKCDQISGMLSTFGICETDKIAILSENQPNWAVAFFATTAYGRISVPMLPELSPNEVENILHHSDAKVLFVSRKQLPKVSQEAIDRLYLVIDLSDFF